MTCALQICDDCAKVRLAVHARAYAVTQPGKHAARTGSSSVVDLLSQPLTRTCETGRGDDTCQRQASHGSRARLTSKSQCVGEDEKLLAELTLQAYSVNIAQGKRGVPSDLFRPRSDPDPTAPDHKPVPTVIGLNTPRIGRITVGQ